MKNDMSRSTIYSHKKSASKLPVADEGCIIDVRPKPRPAGKDLNGEHYLQIEYSSIDASKAIVFELPALVDDEAKVSTYQFDEDYVFPLKKGRNMLSLVHEGDKVSLVLLTEDGVMKRATNDQPSLTPFNPQDPIYHPTREPLEDFNKLRVVRIRVQGRGFTSGFTLIGAGLLLQPKDLKIPPKP